MAKSAVVKKIPHDIEYRVIGNAFGLLIALGGLLAGAMVSQHSIAYWHEDIVPLGLLVYMGIQLLRNFMANMTVYQYVPHPPVHHSQPRHENVQADNVVIAQIPELPAMPKELSPEQVVEEVV